MATEINNPPNKPGSYTSLARFLRNILLKGLILFVLVNVIFALWYPLDGLGRISAYNLLFPGRTRLPYGDIPERTYNLSLYNLEAMFASHEINGQPGAREEFRVILIGDSSAWGFLLTPEQTLSAYLNSPATRLRDGRQIRVYNLGYPVMSLTKDILVLSYAMRFEPDLIIWPVTLESFPYEKQLFPPLLQNNPAPVAELIETYELNLPDAISKLNYISLTERTIIGARRHLADLLRLQLYGFMWGATGIDHDIPLEYSPRMEDLPDNIAYYGLASPLKETDLAFDVIAAGMRIAGDTPVLIINEPTFISQGENSDIRYNFFYPRWAYDEYRHLVASVSAANGWIYHDMWDIVPNTEFTNSAIHLTPYGTQIFAKEIIRILLEVAQSDSISKTKLDLK